jgi:hypothetical protein
MFFGMEFSAFYSVTTNDINSKSNAPCGVKQSFTLASSRLSLCVFALPVRYHSSKKYFCPGEMAPSEWTHSVRAVRDTLVADYSAPGVNSTRRVPYRPLIAVSPFLLVLSVSYFQQSLWLCG